MFLSGSKLFSPLNADRSISVPSVAFNGVKECPVPGTRTGPLPCRTAAARATSSLGATISLGLQMTPPDQFDHLPPTIFMKGAALRRQFEMPSDVGEFWGALRSEERRVGKECRSRWARYAEKKRQENSG